MQDSAMGLMFSGLVSLAVRAAGRPEITYRPNAGLVSFPIEYQSINQSFISPEKLVTIRASKTKHMRTGQQGKPLTAAL